MGRDVNPPKRPADRKAYKKYIESDLARLTRRSRNGGLTFVKYLAISKGFRAIYFYRAVSYRIDCGKSISARLMMMLRSLLTDIEISPGAVIGMGLLIPHPQCIVIGNAVLGHNVTIQQGVTIGASIDKEKDGFRYPRVGSDVLLAAGVKVVGPVEIGDNSIIGANAVVIDDIPPNAVAVGMPARVVKSNGTQYSVFLENL